MADRALARDRTRVPCGPASGRSPRRPRGPHPQRPVRPRPSERPAPSASCSAGAAGTSASTIVLSPGAAAPSSTTPSIAASSAIASCSPSKLSASPSDRPARRSAEPHSGPLAPPTVADQRLAGHDQQPAGRGGVSLPGQRLADGVEAAAHVGAVITVADRRVELGEVVALRLDLLARLRPASW